MAYTVQNSPTGSISNTEPTASATDGAGGDTITKVTGYLLTNLPNGKISPSSAPSGATSGSGGDDIDKVTGYLLTELPNGTITPSDAPDSSISGDGGDTITKVTGYLFTNLPSGEVDNGSSVNLVTRGAGNAPIAGTATFIDQNENTLKSFSVEGGNSKLSFEPGVISPGALSGSNLRKSITADLRFSPNSGETVTRTNVLPPFGVTITINFAEFTGTVSDANGVPLSGETILLTSTGSVIRTNDVGEFSGAVESGQRDINVSNGAIQTSLFFTENEVTNQDFSLAGVEVVVQLPGGIPVTNAPVRLGGTTRRTDSKGVATFPEAPVLQAVKYTVYGVLEFTAQTGGQGVTISEQTTLGAGIRGQVLDLDSNSISNIGVRATGSLGQSFATTTTNEGEFSLGIPTEGDVKLLISEGDRRYETAEVELFVEEGDVEEVVEQISTKLNTGTRT